jgi:hypothetical protein
MKAGPTYYLVSEMRHPISLPDELKRLFQHWTLHIPAQRLGVQAAFPHRIPTSFISAATAMHHLCQDDTRGNGRMASVWEYQLDLVVARMLCVKNFNGRVV